MTVSKNGGSEWPAAIVAIAFLIFVGGIFLVVFSREGIDAALKAWGAFGTIVGVLTGAIPSYFFQRSARAAQRNANLLRMAANEETITKARALGLQD